MIETAKHEHNTNPECGYIMKLVPQPEKVSFGTDFEY